MDLFGTDMACWGIRASYRIVPDGGFANRKLVSRCLASSETWVFTVEASRYEVVWHGYSQNTRGRKRCRLLLRVFLDCI